MISDLAVLAFDRRWHVVWYFVFKVVLVGANLEFLHVTQRSAEQIRRVRNILFMSRKYHIFLEEVVFYGVFEFAVGRAVEGDFECCAVGVGGRKKERKLVKNLSRDDSDDE